MRTPFGYNLFIYLMRSFIRAGSFFSPALKKWDEGRKHWKERLSTEIGAKFRKDEKVVWMHAASLGEYEQGKPVIENLKRARPGLNVIVSFFSPSGYEIVKRDKLPDLVCYLPADTRDNAADFLALVKPDLVLWVKYEYWWNHLCAIANANIPVLLISAIFRKEQAFFKWYGTWQTQCFRVFTHAFVQNQFSENLLATLLPREKITVSGDTRFDRVRDIASRWQPVELIEQWKKGKGTVAVAGSTWPEDETNIQALRQKRQELSWIIAPHKVGKEAIAKTIEKFPGALKFSDLVNSPESTFSTPSSVLVVDTIGLLSRLYAYGDICLVGGGFGSTGLHNTLEAAVYGKPVIFGANNFSRFAEAVGLVNCGGAVKAENSVDFENTLNRWLDDEQIRLRAGKLAAEFVAQNAGAVDIIISFIYEKRLLTSE